MNTHFLIRYKSEDCFAEPRNDKAVSEGRLFALGIGAEIFFCLLRNSYTYN